MQTRAARRAVLVFFALLVPAVHAVQVTETIDAKGDGAGNTLEGQRVAVDVSGHAYVTEASQNVFKITRGTVITEIIGPTGDEAGSTLEATEGLALDGSSGVYARVSSSNSAFKISLGAPGTCTARNGLGVNPSNFTCANTPVIGGNWDTTVALSTPDDDFTVVAIGLGGPTQGIFLDACLQGELLCLPPFIVDLGRGAHSIPIPDDSSLVGTPFCTQAANIFFKGFAVLGNAIDVTIGTP